MGRARRAVVGGVLGALLAVAMAPAVSAQCADPRGNSYCTNGGQVTVQNPSGGNVNVTNPTGGNVNVTNPTGGNVNVTNPNAGDSGATNPNAGDSGATNPNAGDSGATNPNAPIAGPRDLSVVVAPDSASVGDTIAVAGRGFTANGRGNLIFINVVGVDGVRMDANYKPITCVQTDDFYLGLLQDLGWGCSSESAGPLVQSADDGTFRATIKVPPVAPGDAKVCISSVFSNPVCTPLAVDAP